MCEYLDYEVETLKRIRIMNIKLDVNLGTYRALTKDELLELNQLLESSDKTFKSELKSNHKRFNK